MPQVAALMLGFDLVERAIGWNHTVDPVEPIAQSCPCLGDCLSRHPHPPCLIDGACECVGCDCHRPTPHDS
jgi:hypothetical protein